ncbi:MAG: alpha/beta hydrolase family protein [Kofleriaceae bacterium]
MQTILLAAVVVLASCAAELSSSQDDVDAPNFESSSGITVSAVRWISARTLEVDISTALIAPVAVNGPHRLRVTLPGDYFANPAARYPVLYLLHGGAGGNSAQWTTGGGAVEQITDGQPIITVMPDGGKVGWFTDWVDQTQGAQRWAEFYVDQVIPWVDHNLRTVTAANGRAIAGLSMGGYGAVRIAEDRPDLFASVASFSGAVDLGDLGTRTVVTEQAVQSGFAPGGPFGSPFWPNDTIWNLEDTMKRPGQLAGLQVLLYAGAGTSDGDVIERTMGQSADRFSHVLDAAGISHGWWMYGRPGPTAPFGCDGGHDFTCWNFALADALPRMLAVLHTPPSATTGPNVVVDPGFEAGLGPWQCTNRCGTDTGTFAHAGTGNAWVRNDSGWNDAHQTIAVVPGRVYQLTGWIRTSANTTDGYFGLRSPTGEVLGEHHFQTLGDYTRLVVTVASGPNTSLVAYAGLWADGDTWLQLDDVSVAAY